ncbi:hypothetical protein [Hahella sp. HN01]|uniref:hypothetical protein n=1 Tax=Hahella sp. HN01 TaxID=2847262 RepID=UPI001C1EFC2E|nr:hypothetical protein [Hahella sp. HN01]MBU6953118.1 hypothetical protein [Hahella sp. HN01]
MQPTALDHFIESAREGWDGLTTSNVIRLRRLLQDLAKTSAEEPWLAQIHADRPDMVELYTDLEHGFRLLAHTEPRGLYRAPHDHGFGWVLYALQHGALEMSTYQSITDKRGGTRLVSRGCDTLNPGDCRVFLPGDIHDTKCVSDYIVQFRLTSSDFKLEKKEGRMIQYVGQVSVA